MKTQAIKFLETLILLQTKKDPVSTQVTLQFILFPVIQELAENSVNKSTEVEMSLDSVSVYLFVCAQYTVHTSR